MKRLKQPSVPGVKQKREKKNTKKQLHRHFQAVRLLLLLVRNGKKLQKGDFTYGMTAKSSSYLLDDFLSEKAVQLSAEEC